MALDICLMILVFAAIGFALLNDYLQRKDYRERLTFINTMHNQEKERLIEEVTHFANCVSYKNGLPPVGTDMKQERENRIEEAKAKRVTQTVGIQMPSAISPIQKATQDALALDALKNGK